MRTLIVLIMTMCLAGPAWAGTAGDPDVVDPCGDALIDGGDLPENDICAAWIDIDVDANGGVQTTASVQTAAPGRSGGRYTDVTYGVGDCTHVIRLDETAVPLRTHVLRDDFVLFPDEVGGASITVTCPAQPDADCPYPQDGPVVIGCGRTTSAQFLLSEDAVTRDGSNIDILVDYRSEALLPFAPQPGSLLTTPSVRATTAVTFGTGTSHTACTVRVGPTCSDTAATDRASGRDVQVPLTVGSA